ncbi:insulin receptor substrate 1-B isoform X4 [Macrobrachium rosenbergii]|uniref:insulin receptor substrate 1-B isoform X4 n=1 Tax=Macrobrachium rosenbergii TaxID=79674 RepID=UPI0034D4DEBB
MKAFKYKSVLSPKCVAVSVWKFIGISKMSLNKVRSSGSLVNNDDIVKSGHLKKLKTMKKKFFVLRRGTGPDSPARLEYYDSEKKFRQGAPPKKPIILRSCFSINKKKDAKHNHVIALHTDQDSVSVAAESEAELNEWLSSLKVHMQQSVSESDGQSKKLYEHVWLVVVQPRSLGSSKSLTGEYRICLTYRSIAMVRNGDCHKIEFPLNSIRRCGHADAFFFLGLGRSAITGAGDLWMLTEDPVIAENMHNVIQNAIYRHRRAMHDPCNMSEEPVRERTQSMSHNRSIDGTTACHPRSRCGSMPSRSRTSSEGSVQTVPNKLPPPNCSHQMDGPGPFCLHPITRPQSMYSSSLSSYSQPFASALFSPGSSESMESNTSVDECDGPNSQTPDVENSGIDEEASYVEMERGNGTHTREQLQTPFTLPINSRTISTLSKGLVSPVSGSSMDGQCVSSPHDNYLEMASPSSERIVGSMSDRGGYMLMDRAPSQPSQGQGSVGSESSGYLQMAPLNSPGSSLPSWPTYTSSQVSSPPHSANHSRIPSLVDDSSDSYLPMAPVGHIDEGIRSLDISSRDREGYLDMTVTPSIPLTCSPSDGDSFPEMSPGSSCSFTSGTPSSDHRFPEFIAEKSGSGSYCGYSEDDDSSIERPIRTNSVGSKPEQFRSRKNRLEVSPAEPARVRAFSVGSRVGLRLAGSRTGYVASGTSGVTSASITEFSPSIKEKGKQVKSKSTSAPILGSSPISNSWSGTPGTFFRGFLQTRNQERSDLMEFDFTRNKSCDSITSDKEKKSSSIESFRRTITGQRHRSNSKSSGNGKSSVFDSIKRDKKKSESESSGKGIEIPNRKNYFELETNPSPRRSTESNNGYLPMKPAISLSQSSTTEYLDMTSKEPISRQPFTDSYMDMSRSSDRIVSSLSTSTPHEGYVDMSQGKGIGPLTPISSSSTLSNSSSFIGARVRKISSTFIPMSSQDTCSQLDEYMPVDLRSSVDSASQSHDGEKKKKEKKSTKRKSFKDSKRKKSDPIAVIVKGDGEVIQESSRKGTSPLSHWSTFLGRKNSSGTPPKTPLSPTGSPLPKSSRGTPSPFSSLTRSKNRDGKENIKDSVSKDNSGVPSLGSGFGTNCIEESSRESEESAISADSVESPLSTQTVPNNGEQSGKPSSKRSSGIFELSQVSDVKSEDKQANVGVESISHTVTANSQQQPHQSDSNTGDMGAYVNLVLGLGTTEKNLNLNIEKKQRKISSGSGSAEYMNISPVSTSRLSESEAQQPPSSSSHDYVNMCPGGRRPESNTQSSHLSPQSVTTPSMTSSNSKNTSGLKIDIKKSPSLGYTGQREQNQRESKRLSASGSDDGDAESGYQLMTIGTSSPKPTSPRVVTRRPDIPPALLGGRPDPSLTANLDRLNLGGSGGTSVIPGGISVSERCRSHSGPGAPEGSAVGGEIRVKKQLSEPRVGSGGQGNSGRAASACSSPVSYSPPTSPTLGGSVSSVSSLSEGGLSSASSTCTVVNVGLGRRESGLTLGLRFQDTQSDSASSTSASSSLSSSQQSSVTVSSGSGDSGLNYVSLDLGPARCEGVMPSPRASRRTASGNSTQASGTPAATQECTVGEEDYSLSYAQIDFTKSEGLRTTSLSRDHRH